MTEQICFKKIVDTFDDKADRDKSKKKKKTKKKLVGEGEKKKL